MVWSIKCWSHKCENQSLIPRIHLKKKKRKEKKRECCVLVISTGKLKPVEPWGLARQSVKSDWGTQASDRPFFKQKKCVVPKNE